MSDILTKDDLRQFGLLLINDLRKIVEKAEINEKDTIHPEWLKSRVVRKLMDMSPGSLQNLRVTGKVRFKKVLGSYYYNKQDLSNLFSEDK
ncbi:DNA-binding protein [Flavobacterium geliluteum]|uniref:DNA-binding protein n=1 Tax=Flavobacterium geliluteum TaxID=2816120 RepID=A0A940X9X5_9FLAO|nr:DNA-binding protein [Flavobacterium geliluteum]MBP4139216.1 DNA-binding protein [Flavobacterium geliluteum]